VVEYTTRVGSSTHHPPLPSLRIVDSNTIYCSCIHLANCLHNAIFCSVTFLFFVSQVQGKGKGKGESEGECEVEGKGKGKGEGKGKGKGKGKVRPRTDYDGPEGEQRYNCSLSLPSALDRVGD